MWLHPHVLNVLGMQIRSRLQIQISHVVLAHGYFAYVNEISFAYPEHLVCGGVALHSSMYIAYILVSKPTPWAVAVPHGQLASIIFF